MQMLDHICKALAGHRYSTTNEAELQDALAGVLNEAGVPHTREHRLSAEDRPDFAVPVDCCLFHRTGGRLEFGCTPSFMRAAQPFRPERLPLIAIEVKVDGSLAALTRQLHRYAQHDEVAALVAVSPRARHTAIPREISGKPVRMVSLLGSAL